MFVYYLCSSVSRARSWDSPPRCWKQRTYVSCWWATILLSLSPCRCVSPYWYQYRDKTCKVASSNTCYALSLFPTPQQYYIAYLFWSLSKVVDGGNGGIPLHRVINLVNVSWELRNKVSTDIIKLYWELYIQCINFHSYIPLWPALWLVHWCIAIW